jgi:hypothetical protein
MMGVELAKPSQIILDESQVCPAGDLLGNDLGPSLATTLQFERRQRSL